MSVVTNPNITFLRTVRQFITPALCLWTSLRKVFYITHSRLQAISIPRFAQMFVRYETEALPSLTDGKDIQIQILYYVHDEKMP